jgi:hypothetical protein
MDDFTKIKLINSLIDVVDRFYSLKDEREYEESLRLKGFCEGLSYALIQMRALDKDEADQIIKGLGKKRNLNSFKKKELPKTELPKEDSKLEKESEIDTIELLKKETKELDIDESSIHTNIISVGKKEKKSDLDLPTYLRKNKG